MQTSQAFRRSLPPCTPTQVGWTPGRGRARRSLPALICFVALFQASGVRAEVGYTHLAARFANDAAVILAANSDATLVPDLLTRLAMLRQAAETDATGAAALAWFQVIDRIDIKGLRDLLARQTQTAGMRPHDLLGSRCLSEFTRRVDRLNGYTFTPWSRRGVPELDWTAGKGYHFVLFGDRPLVRIVSWAEALQDVAPGTPLTPEMFKTIGSGFQTAFTFTPSDIAASDAIGTGDRIVGLIEDFANPDFGLGTLEIADYSFCLLPPIPPSAQKW